MTTEIDVAALSDDEYTALMRERISEAIQPFKGREGNDIDRMQLTLALWKAQITLEQEELGLKREAAEKMAEAMAKHRHYSADVVYKVVNEILGRRDKKKEIDDCLHQWPHADTGNVY